MFLNPSFFAALKFSFIESLLKIPLDKLNFNV